MVETTRLSERLPKLIGTPQEQVPGHLDYLFATPELARGCAKIWVDDADPEWQLSDHRAVVAEFELAETGSERAWEEASFIAEVRRLHGDGSARLVETLLAWGERQGVRVHFEDGTEGQVWFQIDDVPVPPQYTFSIRTRGDVVIQFQYMMTPFDDEVSRSELQRRLNQIRGVNIQTAKGRPTIPFDVLAETGAVAALTDTFSDVVARTRAARGGAY